MATSYEDFINQYSVPVQKQAETPSYEDFIKQHSTKQPSSSWAYLPESILPSEDRKALARGIIGAIPDLAQLIARVPHAGLKAAGVPVPEINEKPLSEDVFQLMKDAGYDITPSKPATVKTAALEGLGASVSPAGPIGTIGNLASKAISLAGKVLPHAVKNIPYLSKGVEKAAQMVPEFFKGPKTLKEAAVQGMLGAGISGGSEALMEEGVSPLAARTAAIGTALGAPIAGRAIAKSAPFKSINPYEGPREATQRLSEVGASEGRIAESLENIQPIAKRVSDIHPLGEDIRNDLIGYIAHQKELKKPIVDQYEAAKLMPDLLVTKNAINYIKKEKKNLRFGSKIEDTLNDIRRNLAVKQEGPDIIKVGPEGTAHVQKNKGMPINHINQYISELSNEAAKASVAGDRTKARFLNEVIEKLNKDLESNPAFAERRKAYREAMAPINLIESDPVFGKLLEKTDYNVEHLVKDSEIPQKVVDFSLAGKDQMKRLMDIVGKNPETTQKLKDYANTLLINRITNPKGQVQLAKLDTFVKNNPGIFVLDPSLETKLKSVSNAQAYHNRLLKGLLKESTQEEEIWKSIAGKAALGAALGQVGHLPGIGIAGTTAGIIGGLQGIKKNAYKKALQQGLIEKGY